MSARYNLIFYIEFNGNWCLQFKPATILKAIMHINLSIVNFFLLIMKTLQYVFKYP